MIQKKKVAVVISHPIQHFCPQYASWAKHGEIELKVFFGSALGYKKYYDENFKKEVSWDNLKLDEFNHVFLNGDQVLQSNAHLDAGNLENELDTFKPDFVIIYGYFQKLQRRAKTWASKNRIKIGYISDSERRQKLSWLRETFKFLLIYKYFKSIDFFLTVGDANESYYKYYFVPQEKFLRMHFPIDISLYDEVYSHREVIRKKLRLMYRVEDDEIVLITVGKLQTFKAQDHIVKAVLDLKRIGPKIHIIILGSGELGHILMEYQSKMERHQIHLVGFVNSVELPDFYAASDIYIHPSKKDRHSLSVSEAIYMGLPVLISNRCGSYGDSDDVQEGKNGYVYEYGNILQLCSFIENLINDEQKRKRFSSHSHFISTCFQKKSHHLILDQLICHLK